MKDKRTGDAFHSQVLRPVERRDTTVEDIPVQTDDQEDANPEVRLQNMTRDRLYLGVFKEINKNLEKQNDLTRELVGSLRDVRDQGHVERDTLMVLKDIDQKMKSLGEGIGVSTAVLNAVCEVRDGVRDVRDAVNSLTQTLVMMMGNGRADHH